MFTNHPKWCRLMFTRFLNVFGFASSTQPGKLQLSRWMPSCNWHGEMSVKSWMIWWSFIFSGEWVKEKYSKKLLENYCTMTILFIVFVILYGWLEDLHRFARQISKLWRLAKLCDPASSKWPFDHPNGGHFTPEKVTNKTAKKATRKNLHNMYLGKFHRDLSRGHPKWWFRNLPKIPWSFRFRNYGVHHKYLVTW